MDAESTAPIAPMADPVAQNGVNATTRTMVSLIRQ